MRDQGDGDDDENDRRHGRREEPEVGEAPYGHDRDAKHVNGLPSDDVGKMPKQGNRDEGHEPGDADRPGQKRLVELRRGRAEREYEDREQIEGRLLGKTQQGAEDDLAPVATDDFPHGRGFDPTFVEEGLKDRRFHDPEPDVKANADQHDAEQERNPPRPGLEGFWPGQRHGEGDDPVGENESDRNAKLRPAAEPPLAFLAPPLHGHEHRPAPLTADANALAQTEDDKEHRGPEADVRVGRHQPDDKCRQAHHEEGRDECGLAADSVAVRAEQPRPDRAGEEAGEKDDVDVERPGELVGLGEEQLGENQRAGRAEQKVVVPLDRGPDGAGHHRLQHVPPPFLGRHGRQDSRPCGTRHIHNPPDETKLCPCSYLNL